MAKKKAAAVANGGLLDDSEASSASESLENPSTAEVSGESVPAHDGATLAAMALPVADRSNAAGDVVADPEPLAVDSSANVIERPPKQVTGRPRNDGQPILPRVVMPGGVKLPARDAAKIVEVLEARGVDRSLIFPGVAATIAQAHGGNGAAIRPGVLGSSVRPASGGPSEVSDDAPAASVSPFARRRVMG